MIKTRLLLIPSIIAKYFDLECDRFLYTKLCSLFDEENVNDSSIKRDKMLTPHQRAGYQWERDFCETLRNMCDDEEIIYLDADQQEMNFWTDKISSLYNNSIQDRQDKYIYIYQPLIEMPKTNSKYDDVVVKYSKAIPDLLYVYITFEDECPTVYITVMDLKLSETPKLYQKIQLSIYVKLLKVIVEGELSNCRVIVRDDYGYIINKPFSLISTEDAIRQSVTDLKLGIIGNKVSLKGAGSILNQFFYEKVPQMEDELHSRLMPEFVSSDTLTEDGQRVKKIDEFLKSSKYIVTSGCRGCVNYERCIQLSNWNDTKSVLFIPYISVSAEKHLQILEEKYLGCVGLDTFNDSIERSDFLVDLKKNSFWKDYASDPEILRQMLRRLEEYYTDGIVLHVNYNDYIKKNGQTLNLPDKHDIGVYFYASESLSDDGRVNELRYAYMIKDIIFGPNHPTYDIYNCNMDSYRVEDVLRFLHGFYYNLYLLNQIDDRKVAFYAYDNTVISRIKKLAYKVLEDISQIEDEVRYHSARKTIIRFLYHFQDVDTLLRRDNHPRKYVNSIFIVKNCITDMYSLPGAIDYDLDTIKSYFGVDLSNAISTVDYMKNLSSLVEKIQLNSSDMHDIMSSKMLWGECAMVSDYYNVRELDDQPYSEYIAYDEDGIGEKNISLRDCLISSLYYKSIYEDNLRMKDVVDKYFRGISRYNYYLVEFRHDEEYSVQDIDDAHIRIKLYLSQNGRYKAKSLFEKNKEYYIFTSSERQIMSDLCKYATDEYRNNQKGNYIRHANTYSVRIDDQDNPTCIYIKAVKGEYDTTRNHLYYVTPVYQKYNTYNSYRTRCMLDKLRNDLDMNRWLIPEPNNPELEIVDVDDVLCFGHLNNGIFETNYTPSQEDALRHICSNRISLIQGPPGTGKTDFIARSVISFFRYFKLQRHDEPVRILLTSNSHLAINNMINKIFEMTSMLSDNEDILFIRNILYKFGSINNDNDGLSIDTEHQIADNDDVLENLRNISNDTDVIIGITSWQCNKYGVRWADDNRRRLLDGFDMVIIDEASQLSVSNAMMALGLVKTDGRAVIVGDDEQLDTIVADNYRLLSGQLDVFHSVFEYYRDYYDSRYPGSFQVCQLHENFRMNEALLKYSAKMIYGNNYTSYNEEIARRVLMLDDQYNNNQNYVGIENCVDDHAEENNTEDNRSANGLDSLVARMIEPEYPLVVCYLKAGNVEDQLLMEKVLVRKIAASLCRNMRYEDENGVINSYNSPELFFGGRGISVTPALCIVVPHNNYKEKLRDAICSEFSTIEGFNNYVNLKNRIMVDTVDKLQGQEREAVIVSYGVADPDMINREAEFIFKRNRLNVALTRARRKMIVFLPDNFAEYSLELLKISDDSIEKDLEFVSGLRRFLISDEETDRKEEMDIIVPYVGEDGREYEMRGNISMYRKHTV